MKSALLSLILILAISFAGCDITGKSIDVVTDGPGIYIDDASDSDGNFLGRVDIHGGASVLIELNVEAATFNNLTGFEFDLGYDNSIVSYSYGEHGGIFGTVAGTDYTCLGQVDDGSVINNVACAAIPDKTNPDTDYYPAFPNGQGYGDLFNLFFTPLHSGWADFTINGDDSNNNILAYGNGTQLTLYSGIQTRSVLICVDADNDNDYNFAECNAGAVVDCDDNNEFRNHDAVEVCNNQDMDCSGSNLDGLTCTAYAPTITGVTANGVDLGTTPQVSGTVNLVISINDISLSDIDGTPAGNNMRTVSVNVGGTLLSDNTPNLAEYTISFNSNSYSDGNVPISITVTDALGLTDTYSGTVNVYNSGTCTILGITWTTTPVNDGGSVSATITGNADCVGGTYALTYDECDGATCTASVDATTLSYLPSSVTFVSAQETVTGHGWWFYDNGDATPSVDEIRMLMTDDNGQVISTNQLIINNVAPDLVVTGVTPQQTTADITFTVTEQSNVVVSYGLTTAYGTSSAPISTDNGGVFSLTGLAPISTYYYRVTATDAGTLTDVVTGTFDTTGYSADFTGDADGSPSDGDVDIHDLLLVATYFRFDNGDPEWISENIDTYDLADDDKINIVDLTLVINSFTG